MLQVGNFFSSCFSSVPFMLHNSFISLITTPFNVIYLLSSLPLAIVRGSFEWSSSHLNSFFHPSSSTSLFLFCFFPFFANDTHIIGPVSVLSQVFHHFSSQIDCVLLDLLQGFFLHYVYVPMLGALGFWVFLWDVFPSHLIFSKMP